MSPLRFTRSRALRLAAAWLVLSVLLVPLFLLVPGARAGTETLRDEFNSIGYGGSDGSLAWPGPWTEWGDDGAVESGVARVVTSNRCRSGNCLALGGVAGFECRVRREVDLTDAAGATVSFAYRRDPDPRSDAVVIFSVRGAGGGFVPLHTINLKGSASGDLSISADLADFTGLNTAIRFQFRSNDSEAMLFIDDVEVVVDLVPGPTTTTTTEPPTTTTKAPTTTTKAPTTTTKAPTTTTEAPTTTTRPERTTTTTRPERTTTTQPARTTTTVAGGTTTTLAGETTTTGPGDTTTTSEPRRLGLVARNLAGDEEENPGGAAVTPTTQDRGGPLRGLGSTYSTVVETMRQDLVAMVLLAMVVAWLAVLGLGRESRPVSTEPRGVSERG